MERSCVGFEQTECTLVLVHVWLWMYHCLVIRWTMTPSQLHTYSAPSQSHTRLLFNYNGNNIRVGFERTDGTLVLMHVWIWMCHCFVYDAPWHHRNCTLACYSTTMKMAYDSALMLMCYSTTIIITYADVGWMYGTLSCRLWTNRK